jgi:pyrimidine operon attenuation protein/uracil phosphoribosyltransferase
VIPHHRATCTSPEISPSTQKILLIDDVLYTADDSRRADALIDRRPRTSHRPHDRDIELPIKADYAGKRADVAKENALRLSETDGTDDLGDRRWHRTIP